jgi:hypothetical protein
MMINTAAFNEMKKGSVSQVSGTLSRKNGANLKVRRSWHHQAPPCHCVNEPVISQQQSKAQQGREQGTCSKE